MDVLLLNLEQAYKTLEWLILPRDHCCVDAESRSESSLLPEEAETKKISLLNPGT